MEFPEIFDQVCARADAAAKAQSTLARATTDAKNAVLLAIADALDANAEVIAEANAADMRQSRVDGMDEGKLDRLRFDVDRVKAAAGGVRHVASLPDPVGQIVRGYTLPNGMRLTQTRVPIGVIGMIYEARPNVTVDVASLCLKSGNAAMLRGGHAAERTNAATLGVIGEVLQAHGFDSALVQSVDDFGRDGATAMMQARGHIDLLVPRGGRGLIQAVVANSKVPVIETGAGNVHIYMDRAGDPAKAIPIIINAKTQRIGVCNACESLVVDAEVLSTVLVPVIRKLQEMQVEAYCDVPSYAAVQAAAAAGEGIDMRLVHAATEEDFTTEYLDYKISVKTVHSVAEAISHINRCSTGHSESIITEDVAHAEQFLNGIDSACVYWNASTRFTDGGCFGFGAEIGISTGKLHARGPMGLRELTTYKYKIYGDGQIR